MGAHHTVDTGLAAITPSAPYSALVMQLDVSTLPATTDAGELGLSRDDDLDGLEAPRVERNVIIDQGAKHIQHGRHAHRCGRIEVVGLLRRGAREIDLGTARRGIHPNRHLNLRAIVQF